MVKLLARTGLHWNCLNRLRELSHHSYQVCVVAMSCHELKDAEIWLKVEV